MSQVGGRPRLLSLHADFADLQWVVDAYALTLAAFVLTAGSPADRFGRRRVFEIGLALFSGDRSFTGDVVPQARGAAVA